MGTDDIFERTYIGEGGEILDKDKYGERVLWYKIYERDGPAFLRDQSTHVEIFLNGSLEDAKRAARACRKINPRVKEKILSLDELSNHIHFTF